MTSASDLELQHVIDSIPAMAWSARLDGTGEFFNFHYLDYVGLTLEQVCDWQWASVIHPDDVRPLLEAWETVRASLAAGELEARIRRYDGVYRWFSLRANPVRDPDGNVIKWCGVNVDIDEQKRAVSTIEAERQLLELIACSRPLREVLSALCQVVEQTFPVCHCEVRVVDRTRTLFEHIVAPSLPPDFSAASVGAALANDLSPAGVAATSNTAVIAEDLQTDARWQGLSAQAHLLAHGLRSAWSTPFLMSTGMVLGTLCVYRRIPSRPHADHYGIVERMARIASIAIDRSRAEEELRRRQYLLETAERISETGSFSWDLSNNKLIWSTQMYRIHELDESLEPVYPNLLASVHPDDAQRIHENTVRVFNGEASLDGEYRLLMPDGRIKYLSTAFRVVTHEDGRRECFGVAQDVTRRRLTEQALDKVRSELTHVTRVTSLGELAASIAHEVNQPLSGIVTNAGACLRMLTSGQPDPERAVKALERIIRDGNRASAVIARLRNLFRRQDFTTESFNLNEAAKEVIAICSHDLQRRRITLDMELDETLPCVVGDRIQLQQVVLNLVLNAADAIGTSEQRHIAVRTFQPSLGLVQLTIRDSGCGIASDDLNRIFEAFYTTKTNGMGIGLSVSKSIVDRHHGELWASANDGPGSSFHFSIPCAPHGRDDACQEIDRTEGVFYESSIRRGAPRCQNGGAERDDAATVLGSAGPELGLERRGHRHRPQARGGIVAGSGRGFGASERGDGSQAGQ